MTRMPLRRPWPIIGAVLVDLLLVIVVADLASRPRVAIASETTTTSTQLLNAVTTGSGSIGVGFMPRCRETAVYVQWSAGTSAGAVTIESAHDASYSGTWAPLGTVTWTAASKEDLLQITGIHLAIRARVSTTVTGGTVSVWALCN